jgi:hypothetical protein
VLTKCAVKASRQPTCYGDKRRGRNGKKERDMMSIFLP